ncbi:MAG: Tex family protein [Motiliproteus sp.]
MNSSVDNISNKIAAAINARSSQVDAAIKLLDEGSTVPFIARYRKEVTGSLDDTQLRQLKQQLDYLRELQQRKALLIERLQEQGKLTPALQQQLNSAETKSSLEELYQPFKTSRRTKAQQAREAGLEPLVQQLLNTQGQQPNKLAGPFISVEKGYNNPEEVLAGAEAIIIADIGEATTLVQHLRQQLWQQGSLVVKVAKGKQDEGSKFRDYFDHNEALRKMPSHRLLAVLRGQHEGILKMSLLLDDMDAPQTAICRHLNLDQRRISGQWLGDVIHRSWRRKLHPQLEKELVNRAREQAEAGAIDVFARNLKELLLAAPAGFKATLGLDPGLRTGVKAAVVASTGKLLDTCTIYPHVPKNQWQASIDTLAKICRRHQVELISIGNGTGSRETDSLVADLFKQHPDLGAQKIIVSEAGASVYSASELASQEFPDLDVTLRGAVSIARRLQDPLAELVKIEPKAIGVGQYQHDVNQSDLATQLDGVVEDCVNSVGVDLNTASEALLQHVSGLTPTLAKNIVAYRDQLGSFSRRNQLQKVPRLGPKAFEQAAGFLRIRDGEEPLDSSAVHPEAYRLVKQIAASNGRTAAQLIGDDSLLKTLRANDYSDDQFGELTVKDILQELEKPGRDPRPSFKTASFRDDINSLQDLEPGMKLQGVISNVTNFGAFVDIGVHQDGLVHISMLADRFVKDPHEHVKAGDIVNVRVLEVDAKRRRISLTMKTEESSQPAAKQPPKPATDKPQQPRPQHGNGKEQQRPKTASHPQSKQQGTMAALFSEALKKGK